MVKGRIIEESCKLYITYGLKTTMDDIAKHMGISKRTIYEHFKDKDELLSQCIEFMHQQHTEEAVKFFEEADNVLEACLRVIYQQSAEARWREVKMIRELRKYYPEVYKTHFLAHQCSKKNETEAFIRKGIEEGVFRPDINPTMIVFIFSEQVNLIFLEHFQQFSSDIKWGDEITEMDFWEGLIINNIRGISTPKGLEILEKYVQKYKKSN